MKEKPFAVLKFDGVATFEADETMVLEQTLDESQGTWTYQIKDYNKKGNLVWASKPIVQKTRVIHIKIPKMDRNNKMVKEQ